MLIYAPSRLAVLHLSTLRRDQDILRQPVSTSNHIPARFSLSVAEVDQLIAAGRELQRNNPVYQQFITDLQRTADM
ncbi:MAG: hypothetical protein COW18_09135 [Zetaproteobacteria bacterium CG12_big_fil_rev_8_21_14_0_65_54_13]|nr:MAG: hypothetical protein COX55_05165 [Zetaproteobacteria bacterium CG23_combo_of_CG06-09_8_20_14_all_54_7]PIW47383.1 MAG: hypothetical protein COW18_09135 [Zetaproteobacteria bacterium CG12_big_fil_rev_8_21_14_0_65_54_13]PIX55158.1 MAG: hypothetical protein COZ50_04335 [Zetaproteobacteria bacterium CG_4_10_14_3_um_filter_54_28]PJA30032.1 MAG: hypothetical protein CO188_05115 [Zetaproteobacteria bacterium CG_4_9_14_3_um_filter_54_145]